MRRTLGDERGSALAIVTLVGAALVLITAAVVSRSSRLVNTTESDTRFGQALPVAESCVDVALSSLAGDQAWTTGETLPAGLVGSAGERQWAVDAAMAQPDAALVPLSDGQCIAMRPEGVDIVYAVGWTPSRTEPARRVRVVRVEFVLDPTEAAFFAAHAFLTNDPLLIDGNPTSHGDLAGIHTNAALDVPGNPTFHDSCLTSSDGAAVSGNVNVHASCPLEPYEVEPIEVPEIVAREFWSLSEYDMCQDGVVRAGPAHPSLGGTAGTSPCTGHEIDDDGSFQGWSFDGCCDPVEGARWSFSGNKAYDGAFFFQGATVRIDGSAGTNNKPWRVLIVVEAQSVCPAQTAGDAYVTGSVVVAPYQGGAAHGANQTVLIAGRDLQWDGNGRIKIPGVVAAAEQVKIDGNPQVEGGFIGEGWCDSPDDNLSATSISGNPDFAFDSSLETIWTTHAGPPVPRIVSWRELVG